MYSYHIFYFPFKWEIKSLKEKSFVERTNIQHLIPDHLSYWIPQGSQIRTRNEDDELYNEKNYFYRFVHPVLYDEGEKDTLLLHFKRLEPQEPENQVVYKIQKSKGKCYELTVDAINLNFYTTGVGVLSFYLRNEREEQMSPEDILNINQYGRRIFPPFIADVNNRNEIAEYIAIEGLREDPSKYKEDFNGYDNKHDWKPGRFIENLILDLNNSLEFEPVIDDRMFVNCWYGSDTLSDEIKKGGLNGLDSQVMTFNDLDDFWYKYIFVDVDRPTCANAALRKEIILSQTLNRWQEYGTLYGISRYSFVSATDRNTFSLGVITMHMRTTYARMIELVIVQRASILKFSSEVTRVSKLAKGKDVDPDLVDEISALYREYIRFVNQIYFREVTPQEQGIELYDLLSKTMRTEEYVRDLDREIEELHQYASLLDEKKRGKTAETLTKIATIFLPATLIAGLFGMNEGDDLVESFWWQLLVILVVTPIMYLIIRSINHKK